MLAQFERGRETFTRAGGRAVAVAMCRPDQAAAFCGSRAPSVTCLCDAQMTAYAAYGLTRGSVAEVMGPAAAGAAVRATLRGHISGRPVGDTWMMPGTFAVDSDGIVRAVHYARHSGDQPDLAALVKAAAERR